MPQFNQENTSLTVKNIIFDLGGVILDIDLQKPFHQLLELIGKREIPNSLNRLFIEFETGKIPSDIFLKQMQEFTQCTLTTDSIKELWNSIIIDFPSGRLELIDSLQKKYRTFLLSNTNELHQHKFEEMVTKRPPQKPFSDYFEKIYYSHHIGVNKPNPLAYKKVIEENHLIPHETLFIDDLPQNIETAKELGLLTEWITENNMLDCIFRQ